MVTIFWVEKGTSKCDCSISSDNFCFPKISVSIVNADIFGWEMICPEKGFTCAIIKGWVK